MKHIILIIFCFASLAITPNTWASDDAMKATLVKIIETLQTLKPLMNQAAAEQPSNTRLMIHFENWKDNAGAEHSGLQTDIEAIQQALIQAVNRETIEPRIFTPLNHDFVEEDSHV